MALATNLAFVTVMDAKIVHKDLTNGKTYTLTDEGTVELPFDGPTAQDTALEAALAGSTINGTVVASITTSADSIVLDLNDDAATIITLNNPTVDSSDSSVYN